MNELTPATGLQDLLSYSVSFVNKNLPNNDILESKKSFVNKNLLNNDILKSKQMKLPAPAYRQVFFKTYFYSNPASTAQLMIYIRIKGLAIQNYISPYKKRRNMV